MIFDLINNEPRINIEGIFIPEFRAIWENDKSKDKAKASKCLSYVYFVSDFSSPYAKQTEDEKIISCKKDYLNFELSTKEWELVNNAVNKYKELQETHSMRLLASAKFAINKLTEYFYSIDFEERDLSGKPVHNSRDLSINLEKVGKILSSLNDLEEIVNRERSSAPKISRNAKPSSILN